MVLGDSDKLLMLVQRPTVGHDLLSTVCSSGVGGVGFRPHFSIHQLLRSIFRYRSVFSIYYEPDLIVLIVCN